MVETKAKSLAIQLIEVNHEEESVVERIRDLEWQIENYTNFNGGEGSLKDKIAARHKAMDKLKYIRKERLKLETDLVGMK